MLRRLAGRGEYPYIHRRNAEISAVYSHERSDWPKFYWDNQRLAATLASAHLRQGYLLGRMQGVARGRRAEAALRTLTDEIVQSSEIEGEHLNPDWVRSSLASRLGVESAALAAADRRTEGVVEMMLDATQNYVAPLTAERLFGWHAALFPTGYSGLYKIKVGAWRDGPVQVVSGPIGRPRVHYDGPAASRVGREMDAFLEWYNGNEAADPVLKAAIAHLWFVFIHPFDDGNGRITRAIAEQLLARSDGSTQRFYSMSARIRRERKAYYAALEATRDLDITQWLAWFLGCFDRALHDSETVLDSVLHKTRFWQRHDDESFNSRERKVLNRLLDGNFEGKLTSSKWARLTKTSDDTALRDINNLLARGILVKDAAGGRSTSYVLAKSPHTGSAS